MCRNTHKIFVEVTARFDADGGLTPLDLIWEDGRHYPIDRILDVRRAASLTATAAAASPPASQTGWRGISPACRCIWGKFSPAKTRRFWRRPD